MVSRVATIFNAILYKRLTLLRKNSSKLGFYDMFLQVYTSKSFAIIPIDEVCLELNLTFAMETVTTRKDVDFMRRPAT